MASSYLSSTDTNFREFLSSLEHVSLISWKNEIVGPHTHCYLSSQLESGPHLALHLLPSIFESSMSSDAVGLMWQGMHSTPSPAKKNLRLLTVEL